MRLVFMAIALMYFYIVQTEAGFFNRPGFSFARRPNTTSQPTAYTTSQPTTTQGNQDPCEYTLCKLEGTSGYQTSISTTHGCKNKRKKCERPVLLAHAFMGNYAVNAELPYREGGLFIFNRMDPEVKYYGPIADYEYDPFCEAKNISLDGANGASLGHSCPPIPDTFPHMGRKKRQAVNEASRDLVIMIDTSGSIPKKKFPLVKRLAAAIVNLLCGDIAYEEHRTRIGIVSFGSKSHVHVFLHQYLSKEDLLRRIKHVRHGLHGTQTCLVRALDDLIDDVFTARHGARVYPDYNDDDFDQDVILITDGCENCEDSVLERINEATTRLVQRGINIYVIGIGIESNCKRTLEAIAQGGRCFHFFFLDNFDTDLELFVTEFETSPKDLCLTTLENSYRSCPV